MNSSSLRRLRHRCWLRRRRQYLRPSSARRRLRPPKVEVALVVAKAIAAATTTNPAAIQQPQLRRALIRALCSQIRAGRALLKSSSKGCRKLRLLISSIDRVWSIDTSGSAIENGKKICFSIALLRSDRFHAAVELAVRACERWVCYRYDRDRTAETRSGSTSSLCYID